MFRPTVSVSDVGKALAAAESDLAAQVTGAMRGATGGLKDTLRDQIRSAGLGARLANTWRGDVYPQTGNALNPAGYVHSNAPAIIDSFSSGAAIRPLAGRKYLWIPSRNVPRARATGRASSTRKMTPEQVLASFGQREFVIKKGRDGNLLAYVVQARGATKRGGVRKPRKGRLASGSTGELLLMFTLTASVTLPKDLDLDAAADGAASDFVERLAQNGAE